MKTFKFLSNNPNLENNTEVIPDYEYYRRRDAEAFRERYRREREEERRRQIRVLDQLNYESMMRGRHEKFMKLRKQKLKKTFRGRLILFLESLGFKFKY